MNTNKNPNLPANAIACTEVLAGMVLTIGTVADVRWFGFDGRVLLTDGTSRRVNRAGTLRLDLDPFGPNWN